MGKKKKTIIVQREKRKREKETEKKNRKKISKILNLITRTTGTKHDMEKCNLKNIRDFMK